MPVVLFRIGVVLIGVSLTMLLLFAVLSYWNLHTLHTRIVPSEFIEFGLGSGEGPGCLTTDTSTLSVVIGRHDQTSRVVSLHHVNQVNPNNCNTTEPWSEHVTQEGTSWLSIYPTKGVLIGKRPQSISFLIKSQLLDIGQYQEFVDFRTPQDEVYLEIFLSVVPDALKNTVAYTRLSDLAVASSLPQLVKGQSVNVSISLASFDILSHNIPSSTRKRSDIDGTSIEKYTSNALNDALSADTFLKDPIYVKYHQMSLVSIEAKLNGTAFDISPSIPPSESAEQNIVSFSWNILPKEVGPQTFIFSIGARFQSQKGGDVQTFYYFLIGQFSVSVSDTPVPFFTLGQVSLGGIIFAIVGLIGSAISVPEILKWLQKRRKRKNARPTPIPQRSSRPNAHQTKGKRIRRPHAKR